MDWLGQAATQALGLSMAAQQQQAMYGNSMTYAPGYSIPVGGSTVTTSWDATSTEDLRRAGIEAEEKSVDPFIELSSHKFHELLDKFNEMI